MPDVTDPGTKFWGFIIMYAGCGQAVGLSDRSRCGASEAQNHIRCELPRNEVPGFLYYVGCYTGTHFVNMWCKWMIIADYSSGILTGVVVVLVLAVVKLTITVSPNSWPAFDFKSG